MPSKKPQFVENEIYHITIRGVDGRIVFVDENDDWRGIFSLYEFNTTEPVTIRKKRKEREQWKRVAMAKITGQIQPDKRDKLVEIIAFVFMPNHIHLLLRQLKLDGISIFMQKFNSGYTVYFNNKHQRRGHLFQGRFKAKHIDGDEYLKTVFTYIHTNPISIIYPGWKEKGVINKKTAVDFLENYPWSSYLDYIGKKNFPSVTNREYLTKIFNSQKTIKEFVNGWIRH
jgi:putative transposase